MSFIFVCSIVVSLQAQTLAKAPAVFTNDYKVPVTDNMYINCLKIDDLSVIMYFSADMRSYDIFKLELHRFGDDDILAAEKVFTPTSKEFQKKYAKLDELKVKILAEEDEFNGSDLIVNTLVFPANSTVNMAFCKSHDLKHCKFYLIVRGYRDTGEKTQFGETVYDKGSDLSAKSVVFTSWENKTK